MPTRCIHPAAFLPNGLSDSVRVQTASVPSRFTKHQSGFSQIGHGFDLLTLSHPSGAGMVQPTCLLIHVSAGVSSKTP
jgi:hypothetical protein